ncbi:hypothetical protein Bbelb_324000 [Branchiostoma belcheri]|nr:hypothetical protein Bbelb_324000 [Branchiostoma belcheri]
MRERTCQTRRSFSANLVTFIGKDRHCQLFLQENGTTTETDPQETHTGIEIMPSPYHLHHTYRQAAGEKCNQHNSVPRPNADVVPPEAVKLPHANSGFDKTGLKLHPEVVWDRGAFNAIWSVQMGPLESGFDGIWIETACSVLRGDPGFYRAPLLPTQHDLTTSSTIASRLPDGAAAGTVHAP